MEIEKSPYNITKVSEKVYKFVQTDDFENLYLLSKNAKQIVKLRINEELKFKEIGLKMNITSARAGQVFKNSIKTLNKFLISISISISGKSSIYDLRLSVRSINRLRSTFGDKYSIDQLCELTIPDLLKIRGLGKLCINEIKTALHIIGRKLLGDNSELFQFSGNIKLIEEEISQMQYEFNTICYEIQQLNEKIKEAKREKSHFRRQLCSLRGYKKRYLDQN